MVHIQIQVDFDYVQNDQTNINLNIVYCGTSMLLFLLFWSLADLVPIYVVYMVNIYLLL